MLSLTSSVLEELVALDIVLDALQYSAESALFYLVPNDGNVVDFRLSYELGLFSQQPKLQAGLDRIVMVLANVPLLVRAMQAWRIEHPNQLIVLRVFTVVPTSFLQPVEKMILPAMMGPMCVIGRGRSSSGNFGPGHKAPMLATLHVDCSFGGVPFSKHMEDPQNGFYVSGVAFSQTTSEMVWQYTAGGLLAFTVVAIAGPLVAGLAGIGLAVGALYVPAGTTLKYLAGIAAARVGALIAAAWTSRPHLIEAFRVPNQQPFRRIMARDVYGINNTRHVIQHVDDPRGSLETETTLSEASYPPSFRSSSDVLIFGDLCCPQIVNQGDEITSQRSSGSGIDIKQRLSPVDIDTDMPMLVDASPPKKANKLVRAFQRLRKGTKDRNSTPIELV